MLFSDAHLHTNPVVGFGAERIAKKFRSIGGWFISIVSLPPYHYGLVSPGIDSYSKVLELLDREARKAREQGLKVAVFMGFHPAEVDYYYKQGVKAEKLMNLINEVFKLIEKALQQNLVDGIGEVGRQHYGTSSERFVFAEMVMMKALELARDYNVPVQLHTEQGGFITAYSIRYIANLYGVNPHKLILHHADVDTAVWAEHYDLVYTAPIKYFNDKYAAHKLVNCMIESDFLDDPKRPGVSAYPWEIASTIKRLIEKGVLSEEKAYRIMVDNISRVFGVSPP